MADRKKKTKLSILFGSNVKRCREERSWTQMDLGVELGIEPSYVSKIENGWANVTLESIEDIANALGIEARELFESDGKSATKT
jgi:transcriptional regulator with XRE-family HTH domain